jgi:hypothetical protein
MVMRSDQMRVDGRTSKEDLLRRLDEVMLDGDGNKNNPTPGLSEAAG